jgi:endonuclease YncB( thermonuclease family)
MMMTFKNSCGLALFLGVVVPGVAHACETQLSHTARVVEIIDGQTVRLDDGNVVRLMGALAPEVPPWWKGPGEWPPLKRARTGLADLLLDNQIEVRFAGKEAKRDRHERLLAQAYLVNGAERIWAQGHMIRRGLSRSYSLKGHFGCARDLQLLERDARGARLGVWRKAYYSITQAASPKKLSKRLGSYQLVEGLIISVGVVRKWTFLNFSNDWRTDFTVAIKAGDRKRFLSRGLDLGKLEGKKVLVHGWIERWNGPAIKATHPEQIEVLSEANTPSADK